MCRPSWYEAKDRQRACSRLTRFQARISAERALSSRKEIGDESEAFVGRLFWLPG